MSMSQVWCVTPETQSLPVLLFSPLGLVHAPLLEEMLRRQRPEYIAGFRAFDSERAVVALADARRDLYMGAWIMAGQVTCLAGLVMLRGWDAGFEVPTLGIVVDEQFSASGIGSAGLAWAEAAARLRGAQEMMLHVDAANLRALDLYVRCGWRPERVEGAVWEMRLRL